MVYNIGMKRGREGEVGTIISISDCLMLLAQTSNFGTVKSDNSPSRIFECKTCNRQFSSFQALGGHRASHKKQKLVDNNETNHRSPSKPKTHECTICGLEFTVGQALGGHMRRHRVAASDGNNLTDLSICSSLVASTKKENNGDFLCLDLNLTPRENGLEFQSKKVYPEVFCFL